MRITPYGLGGEATAFRRRLSFFFGEPEPEPEPAPADEEDASFARSSPFREPLRLSPGLSPADDPSSRA
jgi:hypothetical protein